MQMQTFAESQTSRTQEVGRGGGGEAEVRVGIAARSFIYDLRQLASSRSAF